MYGTARNLYSKGDPWEKSDSIARMDVVQRDHDSFPIKTFGCLNYECIGTKMIPCPSGIVGSWDMLTAIKAPLGLLEYGF